MQFPEELTRAAAFHTHLGPFLVVGLRMGRIVVREFGDEPFRTKIDVHTGRIPPYSCLSDGIQMSTPCTTGNGGMTVTDERAMRIDARQDDRLLSVQLRREIFDWIENECSDTDQHAFSMEIWEMPEEKLFVIEMRTAPGNQVDSGKQSSSDAGGDR